MLLLFEIPTMSKKEKPKNIHQPDDNFFKIVMEDKANAKAYLQSFYPELAKQLDLRTLTSSKDSFLTEEFKLFKSDIVYRCKFSGSKEQVYLSLLWENKSKPERYVAIQLGLYLFLAMHKMIKTKGLKLEPVIPLLFYNGKQKWKPLMVNELFKKHPFHDTIKHFLPNFSFLFKNITNEPPEELFKIETAFFRSAMIAMANKYSTDLLFTEYSFIFDLEQNRLAFLFTYVCSVMKKTPKELREELLELEFTNKNGIMSTLDMLRQEGIDEGMEKGIKKESLKTFLNILKKFPNWSVKEITQITEQDPRFVKRMQAAFSTKDKGQMIHLIHTEFFVNIHLGDADKRDIKQFVMNSL